MTYVLDASAMIAFLRDEPGAGVVSDALLDPESQCHAHALNLCEVVYDFRRATNHEVASPRSHRRKAPSMRHVII